MAIGEKYFAIGLAGLVGTTNWTVGICIGILMFMGSAHRAAKRKGRIMEEVSTYYIEGIKEGRACLEKHGVKDFTAEERLANLESAIKSFAASNPVGQMLRGERDFWKNQIRKAA